MTGAKGNHAKTPERLCACGHRRSLHRGPCRLAKGCDCQGFRDAGTVALETNWMSAGRLPLQQKQNVRSGVAHPTEDAA